MEPMRNSEPPASDENAEWARVVAERYSADARTYRELWAPLLLPHGRRLLDALPLAGASSALDVGAGCGTLLPSIQSRAPSALVVAIDGAPGMLAIAPADFPRAAMDAARLGVRDASVDAVVLAFVLFHTPDPREALIEARRVLRRGGVVGTTTWEGDPDFPAQRVWIEELDAHGAASAPSQMMSNHAPVSTEARVRRLLEESGFAPRRTWALPFGHIYGLEEFLEIRTKLGWNRRRVESLDEEARGKLLRAARGRLASMARSDFADDTRVIFATGIAV